MCKHVILITFIVRQDVDGHFGTTLRLPTGTFSTIMSANYNQTITGQYPIIHLPITDFSKLCRFTALLVMLLRSSNCSDFLSYLAVNSASTGSGLKDASLVKISYECLLSLESYAGLNSLKPFILKFLMCDLDCFSKFSSHM